MVGTFTCGHFDPWTGSLRLCPMTRSEKRDQDGERQKQCERPSKGKQEKSRSISLLEDHLAKLGCGETSNMQKGWEKCKGDLHRLKLKCVQPQKADVSVSVDPEDQQRWWPPLERRSARGPRRGVRGTGRPLWWRACLEISRFNLGWREGGSGNRLKSASSFKQLRILDL